MQENLKGLCLGEQIELLQVAGLQFDRRKVELL